MWLKVKRMNHESQEIMEVSKTMQVSEFKKKVAEAFGVPPVNQRLFCNGKELFSESDHTLHDYGVDLNHTVSLVERNIVAESDSKPTVEDKNNNELEPDDETEEGDLSGATYRVGDVLDCRDPVTGAWFEAKVEKVKKRKDKDGFDIYIVYERFDPKPVVLPDENLRPRAKRIIPASTLEIGTRCMVNYNEEDEKKRGDWYDAVITKLPTKRKGPRCKVFIGSDLAPLDDITILFPDEIFAIEEAGSQINGKDENAPAIVERTNKPNCDVCNDDPKKKCKECACLVCESSKDPAKTLLCDECNGSYHLYCLDPPLTELPDADEWFCPKCKTDTSEVVGAGEKLKASKKNQKPAAKTKSTRDWGKGMACAGRTRVCTVVPMDHFGPIPGVEVGQSFLYRNGASEYGVHRPPVAGIHGKEKIGAFSLVLGGGYEDDQDDGEVFTYTGSGGRDLSGNKRTAEQSSDQVLTKENMGLARDCNAKLDATNGATSTDWKKGKAVRVLRSYKGKKHSVYAPSEGVRYDGIYKVVKYWRQQGKSGFYVWRYELRRDDPSPAPWTKEGKHRAASLPMIYPEGYWDMQAAKKLAAEKVAAEKNKNTNKKRKRKGSNDESSKPEVKSPPAKLTKFLKYEVKETVQEAIDKDKVNSKLWEDVLSFRDQGGPKFLAKVEEAFRCVCCMDVVHEPVTTECQHNICQSCLKRSFKAEVFNCVTCRADLGKNYQMVVNKNLSDALNGFFPSYGSGRR